MPFKQTQDQSLATELLTSTALHVLLYGGSRSGKTFLFIHALFYRALKVKSRHCILRFRFAHAKQSLVYGSIPAVFRACFPELGSADKYLNKADWFYKLPNGSEIWIGGLDDKERTEKILGNEYSTMYFNECSQIPYTSVTTARTRLAEKNSLTKKFYYDENPPLRSHWTHREFIEHLNPITKEPIPAEPYVSMLMNPEGNIQNIDEDYLKLLESLPETERNRFLHGMWGESTQGAVYGREMAQTLQDKRITKVPYDTSHEVHTWWDIGVSDYVSIWFVQYVGREIWLIDYYQNNGFGPEHYAKELKSKTYNYGTHNLPHDAKNRQFTLGTKSPSVLLAEMGIKNIVHDRTSSVQRGIDATRGLFNRFVFDQVKCSVGLEALEAYRYDYDEKAGEYKGKPTHDWSSHACDSIRGLAMAWYDRNHKAPPADITAVPTFGELLDQSTTSRRDQRPDEYI